MYNREVVVEKRLGIGLCDMDLEHNKLYNLQLNPKWQYFVTFVICEYKTLTM